MTQTVPATAVLGPGMTGLAIGLRVLNLDGTTYAAFSTSGVAETSTAGTYRKAGGVVVPLAGGYIVWGTSLVDYAEATVDSASANVTYSAGVAVNGRLAEYADLAALALEATAQAIKAITDDLDVTAVTQVTTSSAGHLTITAGLTFSEAVTGLTIPADWAAAMWTLKYSPDQADTAAVIQLRAENPAALTDGLLRVNGAALVSPITASDGTLTVTQASGRIDIWLSDELTLLLSKATGLGWDIKFIDANDDSSGRRGTADVVLTETKAVA